MGGEASSRGRVGSSDGFSSRLPAVVVPNEKVRPLAVTRESGGDDAVNEVGESLLLLTATGVTPDVVRR